MGDYIEKLKKGKEDSMYEIIDIYNPLIKSISFKVLGNLSNQGLIEECVNDVYLAIWVNRDKFHGDEVNFKKWCATIAKFKAIDYYRKYKKLKEEDISEYESLSESSLEDEVLKREFKNDILKALGDLGERDEEIFELKYVLGYKGDEIAQRLNMSKEAVNSRIFRGRKKLKMLLENRL